MVIVSAWEQSGQNGPGATSNVMPGTRVEAMATKIVLLSRWLKEVQSRLIFYAAAIQRSEQSAEASSSCRKSPRLGEESIIEHFDRSHKAKGFVDLFGGEYPHSFDKFLEP